MTTLFCRTGFITALLLSVLLLPSKVLALEVRVVDQRGNPIQNAVVALPVGSIVNKKKQPAVIDQVNSMFVPSVLAIGRGQQVVFPNSDNIRHHVYSFSKPKRFEIKLYEGVPEKPILFDEPGIVSLGCNIHDGMVGYIFVSPWPDYALTDSAGKVLFANTHNQLAVWHPDMKNSHELVYIDIGNQDQRKTVEVTLPFSKKKKSKRRRKLKKLY